MSRIKVIIFDFDDTVYQGEKIFDERWTKACILAINHFFKKLNDNQKKALFEKYDVPYNFDKNLLKEKPGMYCYKILTGEGVTIDQWIDYWETNLYSEDWSHVNNVISNELLNKLSQQYKLYIVTNSLNAHVMHYCKELKIDTTHFNKIYSNYKTRFESNTTKDFYYKMILEETKVLPKECLVIGDSFEHDIIPANQLNMETLHINYNKYDFNEIFIKLDLLNN